MKKLLISFLALLTMFTSCENGSIFGPDKASDLKIVVHNKSNEVMTETSLYLNETTDNQINSNNLTKIPLTKIVNLQPGDSSKIIDIDLKDFSKGNRGNLYIESLIKNQKLSGFGRNYNENFNYVDDSYPGFNTIEFFLVDTSRTNELRLTFTFSKYSEQGKLLKRGSP